MRNRTPTLPGRPPVTSSARHRPTGDQHVSADPLGVSATGGGEGPLGGPGEPAVPEQDPLGGLDPWNEADEDLVAEGQTPD